ncbi:MAG: response regulator [Methylocystis sp.]|jgi:DNA-binding response OmpR family regulator
MSQPLDSSPPNPQAAGLQGLRILIVEDNPYIAIALEEMLSEHGLVIAGVAGALDDALLLAASASLDIALLDVNIRDRKIDPVAEALTARGKPFVFTTGCGRAGLPEAFLDRPVVEKPFYIEEILETLQNALNS